MTKLSYQLWLVAWILSVVGYGGFRLAANWQAPVWLNVLVTLLGLVCLGQWLRWTLHQHRERVSARCNARAAADHARRNYR